MEKTFDVPVTLECWVRVRAKDINNTKMEIAEMLFPSTCHSIDELGKHLDLWIRSIEFTKAKISEV